MRGVRERYDRRVRLQRVLEDNKERPNGLGIPSERGEASPQYFKSSRSGLGVSQHLIGQYLIRVKSYYLLRWWMLKIGRNRASNFEMEMG